MDVLGDYTIQKHLSRGAFGDVYLGEHRFIKKPFLIKVLPEEVSQDPTFLRKFEMQIAEISALDHPNIVKIHNVSCSEGRYFLVMDPIADSLSGALDLDRYLQMKGPQLPEEDLVQILDDVASALDFAHTRGVAHGSLKLTNIIHVQGRFVLSDFGVLRLIGEWIGFSRLCKEMIDSLSPFSYGSFPVMREHRRQFVQGFGFLSPEQKMGEAALSEDKADSYAFGVLSYYLLTRRIPEGCLETFPDKSLNWDALFAKCLQASPKLRPQKLKEALHELLHAPRMQALSEIEPAVAEVQQMAFEFAQKVEVETAGLKPVLKPQEIARPEYEADPAAIFQRDLTVSHYTPNKVDTAEITPILTDMVVIPGGTYLRGSKEGARDEMPRHAVHLQSFALDIHPVTNEQFVRFLQVMGGEKDQHNNDIIRLRDARIKRTAGKLTIESGYAKHPVVGVTWYGAVAYAKWVGKRLPWEAEWEAAASGGKEGFLFPTGADIDRQFANFFSSDTTPVMSYAPNPFGLYDMAGNVYDWCQDWYAYNYYDTSCLEPDHPKGPQQGVYRVLRGGCWKSLKEDLRCSHRHRNNPGAVNGTYGFRCAADVAST